jgi:hypothetical protein
MEGSKAGEGSSIGDGVQVKAAAAAAGGGGAGRGCSRRAARAGGAWGRAERGWGRSLQLQLQEPHRACKCGRTVASAVWDQSNRKVPQVETCACSAARMAKIAVVQTASAREASERALAREGPTVGTRVAEIRARGTAGARRTC